MHSVNISLFFAAFSFIVNINARNVNEEKPRLFGYSYTTTVIKPHIITSFIPSSCVQVDATLPPCRIMRSFSSFPSLEKSRSLTSSLNTTIMTPKEDKVQTTPLSWGEYLGIYAPTVTVTSTQVIITTVVDPGVQVTYAIKGCKPKVLPAGLERCALSNEEENKVEIKPTKIIEIQKTSTLQSNINENYNQIIPLNTTAITSDFFNGTTSTSLDLESSNFENEDLLTVATPIDGLEEIGTTPIP